MKTLAQLQSDYSAEQAKVKAARDRQDELDLEMTRVEMEERDG